MKEYTFEIWLSNAMYYPHFTKIGATVAKDVVEALKNAEAQLPKEPYGYHIRNLVCVSSVESNG